MAEETQAMKLGARKLGARKLGARRLQHWVLVLAALACVAPAAMPAAHGQFWKRHSAAKAEARREAEEKDQAGFAVERGNAVLWQDPGDISTLDLLTGPGGPEGKPAPPFTFEAQEPGKQVSRIDVRDGAGKRWSVQLGRDARPEVAASRLLWAAGYLSDIDYVMWKATVEGVKGRSATRFLHHDRPPRYRRGHAPMPGVGGGPRPDYFSDVRFAEIQEGQKKVGVWHWRRNAFTGTREMNGLRVLMAVLNCWDLRDDNNLIVLDSGSGKDVYKVAGLGASFGKAGPRFFHGKPHDDPRSFAHSHFIVHRTAETVDFATPARSMNPFSLFSRKTSTTWVGRDIPRADARWIGRLLGQLSHKQIEDIFWAAGYGVNDVNAYANVVDARIRALGDL